MGRGLCPKVLEFTNGVHPQPVLAAEGGALALGTFRRALVKGLEFNDPSVIERATSHGIEDVEAIEVYPGLGQIEALGAGSGIPRARRYSSSPVTKALKRERMSASAEGAGVPA